MEMDNEVVYIKLDDIIPNRFQPREIFDEKALNELADSIRQHGVIQPIIVRQVGNKYEIIAGERRYKASALAGLTKIPVIIKNLNDKDSSIVAFIENAQRKDVSCIEEARTSDRILKSNNMTQQELAIELGISQSALANKLRLLALPLEVQDALMKNEISERHARSLLSVNDREKQIELLNKIVVNKMTVRDLENEIKNINSPTPSFNDNAINNQVNHVNNINPTNESNNSDENISGMFIPNIGFVPGYKPGEPIVPNNINNDSMNDMNNNFNNNVSNNMNNANSNYTRPIDISNQNSNSNFNNYNANYNNTNNNVVNNSYIDNDDSDDGDFDISQYENNNVNIVNDNYNNNINNNNYNNNNVNSGYNNAINNNQINNNVNIDQNGYIVDNKNVGFNNVDDVINDLKLTVSKCKNANIKIDTEEVDFDDMYQITIKINKNENF